mmetsp:Transcript_47616/g.103537  ORF Transcript_47616/g.103537 Transcript_47616/m.103537 type:complete len:572 (-) Transcript_47616:108-1823(-)|eukprot:CAMPEP_0170583634 /NCGR_PEP_ID=MMETSP0224-20130122/8244_1 /TAXON_ID=285029 /ORGANISM="Togula jolla, Strain CCCM 725" /LENGTH=571 /DNA_ID=CAMNT_0010906983 /DNA_START=124 /DNA_END=1839 /DNA_ORIENTATION=+
MLSRCFVVLVALRTVVEAGTPQSQALRNRPKKQKTGQAIFARVNAIEQKVQEQIARAGVRSKTTGHKVRAPVRPIVYIQDFFPEDLGFDVQPGTLLMEEQGFSTVDIYGEEVCTGDASFVASAEDAPSSFCKRALAQPNRTLALTLHDKVDFDEFALERLMLGRWLSSPLRCGYNGASDWCREHADVVVVPSFSLHNMLVHGFSWPSASTANQEAQELYWDTLREKYYKPEENYTPLIVMHHPLTFVKDQSVAILQALMRQPADFVDRVIIAGIESHLRDATRTTLEFPDDWQEAADCELTARSERRQNLLTQGFRAERMGSPLMVSLPYPTSLLKPIRWTQDSGAYVGSRTRPISVLLTASLVKGHGSNWIRPLVHDHMSRGGFSEGDVSLVCHDRDEGGLTSYCGLPEERRGMWNLLVNSAFCVEPSGDTPTRSHFYLAVLSGCIPVLFDGGHDDYRSSQPTAWAWRSTLLEGSPEKQPFVDYSNFAVVYNASKIREGNVDFMQELMDMPEQDPDRFQALRWNLDAIAPRMRYAAEECGFQCDDAFSAFQAIVAGEAEAEAMLKQAQGL